MKEIEEIEKNYLLFFQSASADTFKTQLKAEVELEVSKNLFDQLRHSGFLLNEDKWKSIINETHEMISKLKATIMKHSNQSNHELVIFF
jgi:hypothetical protein